MATPPSTPTPAAGRHFSAVHKLLPLRVRRAWRNRLKRRTLETFLADRAAHNDPIPGPITIAGFFSTNLGLGSSSRMLVEGLRTAGEQVYTIDCSHSLVREAEYQWQDRPPPPGCGGALVLYVNPPEVPLCLNVVGREFLRNKTLIGRWWWETETLPETWRACLPLFDEIWAGSSFTQSAIKAAVGDVPVRLVPPVTIKPEVSARTKADFGVAEEVFLVLSVFDLRSGINRKNPHGMLAAFRTAFGDSSNHHYIMRISSAGHRRKDMAAIQTAAASMKNVTLLTEKLERSDYAALLKSADVYLGLHRSEGFGLPIAEAMSLGTPAVVTAWSGVMDFVDDKTTGLVDYELVPVGSDYSNFTPKDARWAQPDTNHAADLLKRLADDPKLLQRMSRASITRIERQFSIQVLRKCLK